VSRAVSNDNEEDGMIEHIAIIAFWVLVVIPGVIAWCASQEKAKQARRRR
jgi:hypothetical protein